MAGTHTPIDFVFEPVEQNSVSNFDVKRRYLTMVGGGGYAGWDTSMCQVQNTHVQTCRWLLVHSSSI